VVFDCCHAGGAGDPRNIAVQERLPALRPGLSEGYYQGLQRAADA
jgi:hypothetical protein